MDGVFAVLAGDEVTAGCVASPGATWRRFRTHRRLRTKSIMPLFAEPCAVLGGNQRDRPTLHQYKGCILQHA